VRNVLGALRKSVHAGARRALNELIGAEDRTHAERAIQALVSDYGAKWPKAVAKVVDDTEALLTFFDYPAEHWLHLRTTNPIWVLSWSPAGRCHPGRFLPVADPDSQPIGAERLSLTRVVGSRHMRAGTGSLA
jgi:Transposase, Mutator family